MTRAQQILIEIGNEMVTQDNRMTSAPIWCVSNGQRGAAEVFLTDKSAMEYLDLNNMPQSACFIGSAYDCQEILANMAACLVAAGQTDHPQAKNAYSHALALLKEV